MFSKIKYSFTDDENENYTKSNWNSESIGISLTIFSSENNGLRRLELYGKR